MVTNNSANNATAATGKVLQGAGVGTASTYSTATYPATATGTGTILRADGTNWVATTATYPNTAGTSGNVLTSDGTNWNSTAASGAGGTLGTPTATTSGTTVLYTGISASAKLIIINFDQVSGSSTSAITLQLGSGSLTASGYSGNTTSLLANSAWSTFAYVNQVGVAAALYSGQIVMSLLNSSTNVWTIAVSVQAPTPSASLGAGRVALSGAIDRFQLAFNGADTFDNGQVNYVVYT